MEFDSVKFNYYIKGKDKLPGLLFKKKFSDSTMVSFDFVSRKKRSVVLQTLYMDSADYQKKKSAETLLMQNAHSNTSKTQVGQTSDNSISQSPDSVNMKFSDRVIPTGIELPEGIKVDKSGKPHSAQAQRDVGYMLSESKFYSLYNVHKLDIGKRWGDLDKQVEDIKKDGFKGGSGTINIVPSSLMMGFSFLEGKPKFTNVVQAEFAPRKGDK